MVLWQNSVHILYYFFIGIDYRKLFDISYRKSPSKSRPDISFSENFYLVFVSVALSRSLNLHFLNIKIKHEINIFKAIIFIEKVTLLNMVILDQITCFPQEYLSLFFHSIFF